MIDLERMYDCERDFPLRFAHVADMPYGRLFYNPDNPLSNDSNHALILRLGFDLDGAVEDLVRFYQGLRLTPRVYPAFLPGEWDTLRPVLTRHAFTCEEYVDHYFFLGGQSVIRPNPSVEVKRVRDLDPSIVDTLCAAQGSDRTVQILRRHLPWDEFHLLAGYVDSQAVTLGSFEIVHPYARVDNVVTHPEHRNLGYCRALIHCMVQYYPSVTPIPLYLWASDPTAMQIYREAGFLEMGVDHAAWGAWLDPAAG
jgi:ribosomal protein S18 acetylase RimI-like enzyme